MLTYDLPVCVKQQSGPEETDRPECEHRLGPDRQQPWGY